MPNRTSIMHPRLSASLRPQFYTSSLAVERAGAVRDPETGQRLETWSVVAGLEALPAAIAPAVVQSVTDMTIVRPQGSLTVHKWQISLNGYYPAILANDRVAFTDGRRYSIEGVESDSHNSITRLFVEELIDA